MLVNIENINVAVARALTKIQQLEERGVHLNVNFTMRVRLQTDKRGCQKVTASLPVRAFVLGECQDRDYGTPEPSEPSNGDAQPMPRMPDWIAKP